MELDELIMSEWLVDRARLSERPRKAGVDLGSRVRGRPIGLKSIARDYDPQAPPELVLLRSFPHDAALDEVEIHETHRVERCKVDLFEPSPNISVEGVVQQNHGLPGASRFKEIQEIASYAPRAVIPVHESKVDCFAGVRQTRKEAR